LITSKVAVLVAVPPGVLTEIVTGPAFRPFAGTVAVICVGETTVKIAFLPSNITTVAPVKFVPSIVTTVPLGPLTGLKPVIVGGGITVNGVLLVAVPLGVVTAMGPVAAPSGTIAVIFLLLLLTVNCAATPPNVTLVAPLKLGPLIVTAVPTPPLCGEKLVMVGGAGGNRTVKFVVLVAVPPGVATAIGPVVAPDGTVAVICVAELTR
jgi:hypothetical protein